MFSKDLFSNHIVAWCLIKQEMCLHCMVLS